MSFFIKNQKVKKKLGEQKRKRKNVVENSVKAVKRKKNDEEDEELTSSSDEDDNLRSHKPDDNDDVEESETAQEKKLRLAKIYLEEIERQERANSRKIENGDAEEDDSSVEAAVARRLAADRLKRRGAYRDRFASRIVGIDAANIRSLRCKEQRNVVTCTCTSTDGRRLFSGSKCGTIVRWSLLDYKKDGVIPFVNPKKKRQTHNGKLKNDQLRNGETKSEGAIVGHSTAVTSVVLSTDNKYLATGDAGHTIKIWRPDDLQLLHTFAGDQRNQHRGAITGLAFRYDTHSLYSCSTDKTVKVWSIDDAAYCETLYGHRGAIHAIDTARRTERAVTGGADASVRVWKIPEESQLIYNAVGGDAVSIDTVRYLDDNRFVTGGDDGRLCLWSVDRKRPVSVVDSAHGGSSKTTNPEGKTAETNAQGGSKPYWISSIATVYNGDIIATGSSDGHIRLWQLNDSNRGGQRLTPLKKTTEHADGDDEMTVAATGYVNSLTFTADGRHLIAAIGREHRLGRWEVIKEAKNQLLVIPLTMRTEEGAAENGDGGRNVSN